MPASSQSPDPSERVNPRTRRVRRAILDAAVTVLFDEGADRVTAARVAEVADVARTTIYRHWPDAGSLLLATVDDIGSPSYEHTTEGDLETDVRLELDRLRARLTKRPTRELFAALASHAPQSPSFESAQRRFIAHLAAPLRFVLGAAVERGELAATCDCELQASLLAAPLLHSHLMSYDKIDDALIEGVVMPWLAANRV